MIEKGVVKKRKFFYSLFYIIHEVKIKGCETKLKKIFRIILMVFGCLFLANAVHMAISANLNAGIVPVILLGVMLLIYGIFFEKFRKKKSVHIFVASVLAFVIGFSGFISIYGKTETVTNDEKAVIVLGCGINGEDVSAVLAKRLDKAIEYHERNPEAIIIVSGGQGPQEEVSEAYAMKKYLLSKGINEEKIIMEDKSTSTITNFRYSHEIMKEMNLPEDSVAFVTSAFHVYRAESYAGAEGLTVTHLGADITWYTVPLNYCREMMAIIKMWVLD